MIVKRRFRLCAAALAVGGLATGCGAMPLVPEAPAPEASRPGDGLPRPGTWVAYSGGGAAGSTTPNGDGTQIVSTGSLRFPIFSVRLGSTRKDGAVEAELLTPAGFHRDEILAGDVHEEEMSGDSYSDAQLRTRRLERALMHHRPILRLRIDAMGRADVESSAELAHHEACAQRLLRAAGEAQLAAAEEEEHKRDEREQLQVKDFARSVSPPLDSASLLLRLANLPLPAISGAYDLGPGYRDEGTDPSPGQRGWLVKQIESHGRAVRSELNLLSAGDSPAARLCRSLAYESDARPRSDTCIIQGVIDRRDGWPIRMTVSRSSESSDGATEGQYRSFDRLAPLQGFAAPPSPCLAGR